MVNLVSSGKLRGVRFLIVPDDIAYLQEHDTEYTVTVTTPAEIIKTKCSCWKAAIAWVERIAKQNDERNNEIDRNYENKENTRWDIRRG